jgi:hypothetical protein
VKDWPAKGSFVGGKHNVKKKNSSLMNPEKVLVPPQRIKLGPWKNSTEGFLYSLSKFPVLA